MDRGGMEMLALMPETLRETVVELFSICVAVSVLETLTGDGRTSRSFRALCALAAVLCAVRVALPALG